MPANNKIEWIINYNDRTSPFKDDLTGELIRLRHLWSSSGRENEGIWDFFPIKLVTLLEVFFRAWVKELVNHGPPFIENAAELSKETGLRFDFAISHALVGRKVSLGDLVAHNISIGQIEQLSSSLSTLLGDDYFRSIETVHDRVSVELRGAAREPIIKDLVALKRTIARLFVVRNVVTHEAPNEKPFTASDVDDFFEAVDQLTQATQESFSFLLYGNYPLTQADLTSTAGDALGKAQIELDEMAQRFSSSPEFSKIQLAWESYAELQARFRSGVDQPYSGSIAPMLYCNFKTSLIKLRIDEISEKPEGQW